MNNVPPPANQPAPEPPQMIAPPVVIARLAAHCFRCQQSLGQLIFQQNQQCQHHSTAWQQQQQQPQSAVHMIRMQQQLFAHVAALPTGHNHPLHPPGETYIGAHPHQYPYGMQHAEQPQLHPLPAGAPAVRFGLDSGRERMAASGLQLQPTGRSSVNSPTVRQSLSSSMLRSIHSMQAQSNSHRALPAPNQSHQDAFNSTIDTSNALSDSEDEGSINTTPPCSPSPRSSRELSSEPPTPICHTRPPHSSHGERLEQGAVERSSSSPMHEDDLVETSEADEPPPRSPRGPPSPTPPPPPPPAAKLFCRGKTRKEYFDAYYQKNKARINAKAKERRSARLAQEKKAKVCICV